MPRGGNRKKREGGHKVWNIFLTPAIANAVEEALHDPLTGKPQYGARAKLVTKLLAEWLERRTKNLPTDAAVAKSIQHLKAYNVKSETVLRQLTPILRELGYPRAAITIEELYQLDELPQHYQAEKEVPS